MRRLSHIAIAVVLLGAAAWPRSADAGLDVLHAFAGGAGDGRNPYGSLILDGTTLYGMTPYGGAADKGVVFKVGLDGTGFAVIHEFTGGGADGRNPFGSLLLDGGTLYGLANAGGDSDRGVIFKLDTDGGGFGLLHEFAGGAADGRHPYGSLIVSGSTLYGLAYEGGDSNRGVVFKIATNGTGYAHLHEFTGGAADGQYPFGQLTLVGSTLYGATREGGGANDGVLFKVGTDGGGFGLLHAFSGGGADGAGPYFASLAADGATLYGATRYGGDADQGVVFTIGTDGSDFGLLHAFSGGAGDGGQPTSSLVLASGALVGLTYHGGPADAGTAYTLDTDGGGYSVLGRFTSASGTHPIGLPLVADDGTIYGMAYDGGTSGLGTIFAFTVPEPGTLALLGLGGLAGLFSAARRRRAAANAVYRLRTP